MKGGNYNGAYVLDTDSKQPGLWAYKYIINNNYREQISASPLVI